jgi:hypothetical protein
MELAPRPGAGGSDRARLRPPAVGAPHPRPAPPQGTRNRECRPPPIKIGTGHQVAPKYLILQGHGQTSHAPATGDVSVKGDVGTETTCQMRGTGRIWHLLRVGLNPRGPLGGSKARVAPGRGLPKAVECVLAGPLAVPPAGCPLPPGPAPGPAHAYQGT